MTVLVYIIFLVGKDPAGVFQELVPVISPLIGRHFVNVTSSLIGEDIITIQEISGIESQPNLNNGQRGTKVAFLLYDKIKESDDPVQCLLKICGVFESGTVNDASLKKHGVNMRSELIGKKSSLLTVYFKSIIRNNHILLQSTAFTFNRKSLYWTKYVTLLTITFSFFH